MSWEMPLKTDQVIRLHKEYGSFHAIDQQLIRPMLEKVIFSAGATMSSIESSSERRPEIPQAIDDQLENGPYLTKVAIASVKDTMTGQDKIVKTVQIATDEKGKPIRASQSTIKEYGISLSPVTINDIVYETSVQLQIAERQKSTQAVQLSQAAAIRASQDAITTAKQGEATAAKAKWEQEAINAKEIALAEKDKQVATLGAQTAEQVKRKLILEGEGEATKRRLIMAADGQLTAKLETYTKVQGFWADAFKGHTGAMVPSVQMGGGLGSTGLNATQQMMEMLSVKAAKDLGLDFTNKTK
jgi:regulator of protease activity HflC (stomatin/prohibitin superfamily)